MSFYNLLYQRLFLSYLSLVLERDLDLMRMRVLRRGDRVREWDRDRERVRDREPLLERLLDLIRGCRLEWLPR